MRECTGDKGPVAIGFDIGPRQSRVLPQGFDQFFVVGTAGVVPRAEDGDIYDDESTDHPAGRRKS